MNIIELTRKLGAEIQATEEYKNFRNAKDKNDKDETLQKQIGDFNLLKMQLDSEQEKDTVDEKKVREINENIVKLYNEIVTSPGMVEFNKAYASYKELCDKISNILLMCENGEDPETCEPSSCTGNCSSCGGCR